MLIKKYRWTAIPVAFFILLILLIFVVPFQTKKGVVPNEDILAVTCIGYTTKDGLPPETDMVKKFHVLKGQIAAYNNYKKLITPQKGACVGSLETVRAELYL